MKLFHSRRPAFKFLADLLVSADYTANYAQVRGRGTRSEKAKQAEGIVTISHVAPLSHLA